MSDEGYLLRIAAFQSSSNSLVSVLTHVGDPAVALKHCRSVFGANPKTWQRLRSSAGGGIGEPRPGGVVGYQLRQPGPQLSGPT